MEGKFETDKEKWFYTYRNAHSHYHNWLISWDDNSINN